MDVNKLYPQDLTLESAHVVSVACQCLQCHEFNVIL